MSDTAVSFDILARDQLAEVFKNLDRTAKTLSTGMRALSGAAKQMGAEMGTAQRDGQELSQRLRQTGEQAGRAAEGLRGAGRSGREAGGGFTSAGERARAVGSQLRELSSQAQAAADRVRHTGMAVASFVGNLAANAVSSLVSSVASAGRSILALGVQTAASNETASVSFELLLGGAAKARKFLGELQKFAAATPFDLPTLKDAASRLLAVGVNAKDVIPLMTRLGDATAGMGTGAEGISRAVYALQQMKQSGKASLEDINQLTDAGIPALDALAAKFGTTVAKVRDMISKGKVSAADVYSAIESGAGPAFKRLNGMMDKQSATLAGKWSTFKDNVAQSLGTAFAGAIPAMNKVVDWAGTKIPEAIDKIKAKSGELLDWWRNSQLAKLIEELGRKFNFSKDIQAIKNDFADFAKTVKAHQAEIEMALYAVAFVIGLILKGILGLIQVVIRLDAIMISVWSGVVRVIGAALNVILTAVERVAEVGAMLPGQVGRDFARIGAGARKAKDDVNDALNRIRKDVPIDVHIKNPVQTLQVRVIQQFGAAPQKRASGGPTAPGPVLVGEQGPELLFLSQPGNVVPAGQTARMLAGAGGGAGPSQMRITGSADGAFATALKNLIRTGAITILDSTGQRVTVT